MYTDHLFCTVHSNVNVDNEVDTSLTHQWTVDQIRAKSRTENHKTMVRSTRGEGGEVVLYFIYTDGE